MDDIIKPTNFQAKWHFWLPAISLFLTFKLDLSATWLPLPMKECGGGGEMGVGVGKKFAM